MKKEHQIKFRHLYHKLGNDVFTTIRGAAQFKRMAVGDVVFVETPSHHFHARILKLSLESLRKMTLNFLKADAEYPGFIIHSTGDFIDLLNSFRAPAWSQVTMDSELTVITLEKIASGGSPP